MTDSIQENHEPLDDDWKEIRTLSGIVREYTLMQHPSGRVKAVPGEKTDHAENIMESVERLEDCLSGYEGRQFSGHTDGYSSGDPEGDVKLPSDGIIDSFSYGED